MTRVAAEVALVAMALLLIKHAVADFFLQTPWQYKNKGRYGHPGGIVHSLIHVATTPVAYLVLAPASLALALWIAAGEFLVHYHVDWAKEQILARNHLTPDKRGHWWALGTDQLAHGLTYVAIAYLLVRASA